MALSAPTIDTLLVLVPDAPDSVLSSLEAHPELASKQDRHGYSLLHAAASYEQLDLLKALIQTYNVDPNLQDEDGETCLFAAESIDCAKELLNLGVDIDKKNHDGQTAAQKLDDEDEQPRVAAYLYEVMKQDHVLPSSTNGGSDIEASPAGLPLANGEASQTHPPPPLPNGVQLTVGTMGADEIGSEPDPEFRRRIEELASRSDFEGVESQQQLRNLISDAVSGFNSEGQGPATRPRLD